MLLLIFSILKANITWSSREELVPVIPTVSSYTKFKIKVPRSSDMF